MWAEIDGYTTPPHCTPDWQCSTSVAPTNSIHAPTHLGILGFVLVVERGLDAVDARGVELGQALQRRVLPLIHQLHGVGVVEGDVRAHAVAGVVLPRVGELLQHPLGRLLRVDDDRHLEAAPADLALHKVLHLEPVLALRRLLVLPLERHKQEVDALVLRGRRWRWRRRRHTR